MVNRLDYRTGEPPEYRLFLAMLGERAGVDPRLLTHWQTVRLGTPEELAVARAWLANGLTVSRAQGAGWETLEWYSSRLADVEECLWWARREQERGRRRRSRRAEPPCPLCGYRLRDAA